MLGDVFPTLPLVVFQVFVALEIIEPPLDFAGDRQQSVGEDVEVKDADRGIDLDRFDFDFALDQLGLGQLPFLVQDHEFMADEPIVVPGVEVKIFPFAPIVKAVVHVDLDGAPIVEGELQDRSGDLVRLGMMVIEEQGGRPHPFFVVEGEEKIVGAQILYASLGTVRHRDFRAGDDANDVCLVDER